VHAYPLPPAGRVTDDKDRLLLNTILAKCYCPRIIEDESYRLSASGLYFAPPPGPLESYTAYIDGLPIIPEPEAFGLHENADITKDLGDTAMLFASLLSIGGGGGGGGEASGLEDRVASVVRECMARLPPPFDIEAVQRKYPVLYEESMNTVLAQEMARFNKLTAVLRDSLRNMDSAIQGLTVMSSELEAAHRSIAVNQVPELWKKVSYPTLKPLGSYLSDLYRRLRMLQDWYEGGQPPVFWLPGFFFVQSFLTAALQNYARKHKIPIDMVNYDFEMLGMDPTAYSQPPASGVYIEGLYLEGCGWDADSKRLCESQPKVLFVSAPCMWLVPKKQEDLSDYPHYTCPVYRTTERRGVLATTGHSTNFVMFVRLPTDKEPDHWIMRGVALVSSLSE
jgi:dynein heavy chain, axonemal